MVKESSVDEEGTLTLVRHDTMTTNTVENFARSFGSIAQTFHSKSENTEVSRHTLENDYIVKGSRIKRKMERIPRV